MWTKIERLEVIALLWLILSAANAAADLTGAAVVAWLVACYQGWRIWKATKEDDVAHVESLTINVLHAKPQDQEG